MHAARPAPPLAILPRLLAGVLGLLATGVHAAESSAWLEPVLRTLNADYRAASAQVGRLRSEIAQLPETPFNQQSGRIGFEIVSFLRPRVDRRLEGWIGIELDQPELLDAIVLVPVDAPYRDFPGPGYGFPVRFKVETEDDAGGRVVADYTTRDFPNPGRLPLWVPVGGEEAVSRVRITMMEPWRYLPTGFAVLALGEVMLLRGPRNVTARLPASAVRVSESFESARVWSKDNLIDGQSVLGAPVGSEHSATLGYHSAFAARADDAKWVQVDLGRDTAFDEVRLIGATGSQLAGRPGFGFPVRFKVECADEPGFAAPRMLLDHTARDFPNPAANPVTIVTPGARARYVRVTATLLWERAENFAFTLSELQVYAGERNVALGCAVQALDNYPAPAPNWAPANLTDGFTGERRLVEWPDWLHGLSRRREALIELGGAEQLAAQARAAALDRLGHMGWATVLAGVAGTIVVVRRSRRIRQRDLERLRQRIAADLHDEIGSNLGSIALLSEMGLRRADGTVRADLEEIHRVARQTADSMRDIVELIQRPAVTGEEFLAKLREVAARMLAGIESTFEVRTPVELPSLTAQRHLLLTFKEALHNIRKHARARRVDIEVTCLGALLQLRVTDDGVGFDPARIPDGHGLTSLQHRAKALGGSLGIDSRSGAGTVLTLTFDPRLLGVAHTP
ncbi:MAG: hypothetical protein JNK23_00540 [Opitutaceae bacterium]|nr:hypothetical protein [Opitutaceae bacterium]